MRNGPVENISIQKISGGKMEEAADKVAVEEPLEIQLEYSTPSGRMQKNIAVTMRTPGNDEELAAGFLFTEGVIKDKESIKEIKKPHSDENRILVILKEGNIPVLSNATRNFYSTSSCGVCGKASIEAISISSPYKDVKDDIILNNSLLYSLQDKLKKQQRVFEETGGIHASVLFDLDGNIFMLREDVGRHNALDKIIGAALLHDQLPLTNCLLFLSGRVSFELLQKASMAGIRMIAAAGAPSSLAVEMARELNITLVGFLKSNRFNIYSGEERISLEKNTL
jgi:FdhD protein